jgi:hypothetical protein
MEASPKPPESIEVIRHPEISAEIVAMAEEDQAMRYGTNEGKKWDSTIDRRNTDRMKSIIEEIGWPTISKVGREASHMAWLLLQHADHDVDFQKSCLALLKSEPPHEIQPKEIAYLDDRVRVREGIPQLFGTQFYTSEEGVFGPNPIEDPEHLEERLAAHNMLSFKEYAKGIYEMNKKYLDSEQHVDVSKND